MARKHLRKPSGPAKKNNPYLINAIAPSRLEFFHPNGITDDVYFEPLYVTGFSDRQPLGWGDAFVADKETRAPVAITCYPANPADLDASINRTVSESENKIGEGMLSYTERQRKAIEAEHASMVSEMLLRDNAKIFNVCIYVILRSHSLEGLKSSKNYLMSRQVSNSIKHVLSNTESAFYAASPFFLEDPFGMEAYSVPMPAITVAWMKILNAVGIDDAEGVLIGTDGRGGIVRLDLETHNEERQNSNVLVVAESGAGKSSLAKHILLIEHILYDSRVIVFNDVEGEYGRLALSVGGDVARIGRDCNISPFEPRCIGAIDAEEDDDEEMWEAVERARNEYVLATTIPFVKTFLEMAFEISSDLLDYLVVALEMLYADFGITTDTTFADYYAGDQQYPMMKDLYDKLNQLSELGGEYEQFKTQFRRLALAVRSAAVGHDKHMWNTRTNFSSSSGFTVIDTQGISSDERIKRAQYYNLITWAWSEVRAGRFSGRYIRLVADEAHTLINKFCIDAAMRIKDIAQRIRKYDGGLMILTPMIVDLLDESVASAGRAVAYNTTYRFFGKSSGIDKGGNLHEIQKLLNIEDEVRDELAQAGRGKFIAAVGTGECTWVTVDAISDWEFEMHGRGGGK